MIIRYLPKKFALCAALLLPFACFSTSVWSAPVTGQGGLLLHQDFNGPDDWPPFSAAAAPLTANVIVSIARQPVGTIDVANSVTSSGALLMTVRNSPTKSEMWNAAVTSGLLPTRTTETNLGKLTLSFDHSISSVRPITVQIESFNPKRQRTGGLEGVVYPAAPDFYLRSALELSTMHAFGTGSFQPTDPFVRITFGIRSMPGRIQEEEDDLRIDNIAYASPAFYVSPQGSDSNDGRTEKTAFANPQKAVDAAQPGDIILLMDGTYHRPPTSSTQEGVINFRRAGTPAAWIVVKNYPGQHPVLNSDSWNTVKVGRGSNTSMATEPALAYLEVRGLHIRGNALIAKQQYAQDIGKPLPDVNGNGMTVDGRFETHVPHHIRFADNLVEYCCGGGISAEEGDWVTAENNICRDNCWWMIYAGSGISFLTTANFDAADNIYKDLIRNNVSAGNRCYIPWSATGKMSDGNGIIIDSNDEPKQNKSHRGRTLIQNNLSYGNGGSGIHAFHSHRVDIVNNTAYYNGAKPELRWGQIFVQLSDDVHFMNNILVTRPDQPVNSVGPNGDDQRSTNITRANNIYFGGLMPNLTGPSDVVADPQFVNASTDFTVADFHLRPGSKALKSGYQGALVPLLDMDGRHRPMVGAPDRGPYQQ